MKVAFDINKFANEFKKLIDGMLKDSAKVKGDIQLFKDNKNELSMNPESSKALRVLVELIVTQAWYYRKPQSFDKEIDTFIARHGANFRTSTAQKDLVELVEKLAPSRVITRAKESIQKLLANYSSIEQFTKKLHDLAKRGKTDILGEKGRDNYLRDFGYWERIPMDRHEMRFIIRSGIYHTCSIRDENDPLEKGSLYDALTRFCSTYLKGKVVEGIDLGNAAGIVDIFVWSYCGKERYNICGSTPKCNECNLNGACLYALTNSP